MILKYITLERVPVKENNNNNEKSNQQQFNWENNLHLVFSPPPTIPTNSFGMLF